MKSWQKERNFRKVENHDGTHTYVITVNGQDIEVSEAVYSEYAKSARKIEYMEQELKRNRILRDSKSGKPVLDEKECPIMLPERELSLDRLVKDDWDFVSPEQSPENFVIEQLENEALYRILDLLDADERKLIDALFFTGMSERELALEIGITQKAVNKRKHKVLEKLRKLFLKNQ